MIKRYVLSQTKPKTLRKKENFDKKAFYNEMNEAGRAPLDSLYFLIEKKIEVKDKARLRVCGKMWKFLASKGATRHSKSWWFGYPPDIPKKLLPYL